MQYYIDIDRKKRNTAGLKAPQDIAELCKRSGMTSFYMPQFPSEKNTIYQKAWLFIVCSSYWRKLKRTVCPGDIVLYQHPMYGNRVALRFIPKIQKKKNCKFIVVIHDLESLRRGIDGVAADNRKTNEIADNILLKQFDAIICHNEHMRQYLISQEFSEELLVNLDIFDYLCDYEERGNEKKQSPSIAIAGNLAIGKCKYVYDIFNCSRNKRLTLHLYGNNCDESNLQKGMIYHGSFLPENLPNVLEGDFGLVWDGTSIETCAGNTGEYLRYNNPHKTSLYLASGMPVIVWKQAAIADFVLENGVGIVVESLYGLDNVISNISQEDYKSMCKKANEIGKKIRAGFYFTTAWNKSLEILRRK